MSKPRTLIVDDTNHLRTAPKAGHWRMQQTPIPTTW